MTTAATKAAATSALATTADAKTAAVETMAKISAKMARMCTNVGKEE